MPRRQKTVLARESLGWASGNKKKDLTERRGEDEIDGSSVRTSRAVYQPTRTCFWGKKDRELSMGVLPSVTGFPRFYRGFPRDLRY